MTQRDLQISPEVGEALAAGRAVVALESTIIAHGMPYPQNLHTAGDVEQVVRDNGAIPATIAIIKGRLKVGLSDDELHHIARGGEQIAKTSIHDLAYVVARGLDGATTVASTMRIAAVAGIRVFATGGIGGVHRGAGQSFDISSDIHQFARSNVAVVTAGAKAILDLGLTLEMLETLGVPVVGFQTNEFPSFYSRSSGYRLSMRCDTLHEVVELMKAQWRLGMKGGIVIANPVPEQHEIPAGEIDPAIEKALAEATEKGISGKEVTPFLLARLAELTEGRSLESNIALVRNNAKIAARIAARYARIDV